MTSRSVPTLAIADCRSILNQRIAGTWASDHFGVVADLQVPTHPPGTLAGHRVSLTDRASAKPGTEPIAADSVDIS
jgi:hypothetical protein